MDIERGVFWEDFLLGWEAITNVCALGQRQDLAELFCGRQIVLRHCITDSAVCSTDSRARLAHSSDHPTIGRATGGNCCRCRNGRWCRCRHRWRRNRARCSTAAQTLACWLERIAGRDATSSITLAVAVVRGILGEGLLSIEGWEAGTHVVAADLSQDARENRC